MSEPSSIPPADAAESTEVARGPFSWLWRARVQLWVAGAAGLLLLIGVAAPRVAPGATGAGAALVWVSLALGMLYGIRSALEALAARSVDIDVLMVVGAGLAAGIGHPAEGALLLFLFTLSGALEELALARTKREIEALHRLMPETALVWRRDAWVECAPEDLSVGERVKIRPGDVVPVDAEVAEGESAVDQSTLTGESLPRHVRPGDTVYSGTVNLDRTLETKVVRTASESSLHKILQLVTEARQQREPMQQLIDRLGEPYAMSVLATSAIVMLAWWLVFGDPFTTAAYTAITFLIVLSPCALIIATPTATLTTIARGARAGVLFKGGQAIERLSRVGAVCFDKTGTLTVGRPTLVGLEPVGWSDRERLLALAASLEEDSTHPIARAVNEAAAKRGFAPVRVEEVVHTAGRGVRGRVDDDEVAVGDYEFVEGVIPVCLRAKVREVLDRTRRTGQVAAVVGAGGAHGAAAVLVIADPVREGAKGLVRQLHALGVKPVRMMTGDNRVTAEHIASRLGLDRWDAELLPEDKVRLLHETKEQQKGRARASRWPRRVQPGVAFIGDGVNDAPALAAADVAVGIGSIGSDAALESSDIVLLNEDLECVPWALRLARRARALLAFNIVTAMSVIVFMGLWTLLGSRTGRPVPMSLGVVAHEGGTLLVVLNSLRLLWTPGVVHDGSMAPSAQPQQPESEPIPALAAAVQ